MKRTLLLFVFTMLAATASAQDAKVFGEFEDKLLAASNKGISVIDGKGKSIGRTL